MLARTLVTLTLALVASLVVVRGGSAAARELRAADNQVHDYPTVQSLNQFGALLEHRTDGRYTVKVFHSRQLGEENDTVEQTRLGAIDINRVNVSSVADLSPQARVLTVPFLFRSVEHLNRVLDGEIGREILDSLEPHGLIGLAFYDSGARSIYNNTRPIRTPADLKDLRVRVQPSASMVAMARALGANPVAMPYGQVMTALATGLIEGAENNWPSYVTTGHFRSARFYTPTEHLMSPEVLVMSKRLWDAMSAQDQAIVKQAALESAQAMRERWRVWEERARVVALETGVAVASDVDRAAFAAAARPLRDEMAKDDGIRSLIERIERVP